MIIYDGQHRSCLTNILESLEAWTKALDEGYGIDLIYLDYRKAFDTVPHACLIEKLKWLGISGKLLDWIANFLHLRKMRVRVRISFSDWVEVLSGVPQGSVLGPLLLLLFVNNLPDWISSNIRMFADDTKIWCSDVKLEFFSKSKLESKKSIKTRNWFLIVS